MREEGLHPPTPLETVHAKSGTSHILISALSPFADSEMRVGWWERLVCVWDGGREDGAVGG